MDDVVRAGKVLYVGISDVPAWIVSYANAVAGLRGWSSFIGVQAEYSLARRDAERDLLPMANALGLTFMAWSPLANGLLTGKYNGDTATGARMAHDSPSRNRPSERGLTIANEVLTLASEVCCTPSQLALAWLCRRHGSIIPIIGARRLEQLEDNLHCLSVDITDDQSRRLDEVSQIELGFPHDFLSAGFTKRMLHGNLAERIDSPSRIRIPP